MIAFPVEDKGETMLIKSPGALSQLGQIELFHAFDTKACIVKLVSSCDCCLRTPQAEAMVVLMWEAIFMYAHRAWGESGGELSRIMQSFSFEQN